jgi:hypothetical protein
MMAIGWELPGIDLTYESANAPSPTLAQSALDFFSISDRP